MTCLTIAHILLLIWFSLHCVVYSTIFHVSSDKNLSAIIKTIQKTDVVLFTDSELQRHGFRTPLNASDTLTLSPLFSGIEPCRDGGECFSGAWLGRTDHLVVSHDLDVFFSNNKKRVAHLLRSAYCEDSSNWFMHKMFRRFGTNYIWGNMPGQTIDALDFSVLHLSTAERLSRLKPLPSDPRRGKFVEDITNKLRLTFNAQNYARIRKMAGLESELDYDVQTLLNGTVVVIPVILFHQGLGGSSMQFRKKYLELTFWSLYPIYKHIVGIRIVTATFKVFTTDFSAFVKHQKDYSFIRNASTLPFYDVVYMPDIPDCSLPISSLLETRLRLSSNVWSFKYVYFTEGDQLLVARNVETLYRWADLNPDGILIPHRLVILPDNYLRSSNKAIEPNVILNEETLKQYRCCMDTGNYGETRVHWKSFSEFAVHVYLLHDVPVVLGNANFIAQKYRICNITGPFYYPTATFTADTQSLPWQPCPQAEEFKAYGDFRNVTRHYQN